MDDHNTSLDGRARPQEIRDPVAPNQTPLSRTPGLNRSELGTAPGAVVSSETGEPNALSIPFTSILFSETDRQPSVGQSHQPECFTDLNLDQIVASITIGYEEYDLKPFFHSALTDCDAIVYRQEIARDVEDAEVSAVIKAFAAGMRAVRGNFEEIGKLHYDLQKRAVLLDAIDVYCGSSVALSRSLEQLSPKSRGLRAFSAWLRGYVGSSRFVTLAATAKELQARLAAVRYCVLINGSKVTVRNYKGEGDYSAEIEGVFGKFSQAAPKDYLHELRDWSWMNHIEAKILDLVAALNPALFDRLQEFCTAEDRRFVDPRVAAFDREIQFYLSYLAHIAPLQEDGLPFSYPVMSAAIKEMKALDCFDLALAAKLKADGDRVVTNDVALTGDERILVVSGPNQGGKTTFARTFGQLAYLARLGCPVPGRDARFFLADRVFTHFERQEDSRNLRGKLQDDLVRIHDILAAATPNSVVVMNEIFTSTTLRDATFLSREVLQRILELDAFCVWVTFIHELAAYSDRTVSMVSTVDPGDHAVRTYKVIRQQASGRSYALSIAEKYGLTTERLKERIER
ncbi:DNA mismatch repair protein MutS [Rhizobium sp. LjRoot258]